MNAATPAPDLAESPYPVVVEEVPSAATLRQRSNVQGYILFVFAVMFFIYLGYHLLRELEIIYVAALFAVVLMPVITSICSLKIRGWSPSRGMAILILLMGLIVFLALFFSVGLPPVVRDLRAFMSDLPGRIPAMVAQVKRIPGADKLDLSQVTARAENFAGALGAYLFDSIPLWLSHVVDIVTGAFLCIYFMLEGEGVYEFFLSLVPIASRRRLDVTLRKAEFKMSKWLIGQGLLMLVLGVCSTVVFGLLHVRYFVLLGVMMGLFNIIPIAGAFITVTLAALAALVDSWQKMAGVLIFYTLYVNIENAVLTPRIMKQSVDLSGLTVLIALLLGSALAGIVGALVAVPTAALVAVLLDEYAVQRDAAAVAG